MINSNAGIGGRRSTASTFSHSTAVWLAVSYRYYLPGSLRLYALLCLSVPDIPNNPSSDQDSIEFPFWVCRRRCAELRPRLSVQSPRFYSLFELDRRFPGTRSARTASICLVGSWARLPALLLHRCCCRLTDFRFRIDFSVVVGRRRECSVPAALG